jgi:hypothetical protein
MHPARLLLAALALSIPPPVAPASGPIRLGVRRPPPTTKPTNPKRDAQKAQRLARKANRK